MHSIRITILAMLLSFFVGQQAAAITVKPTSTVSYLDAFKDAQKVAAMNAKWEVMRATGLSMNPYYGEDAILLVERESYRQLKEGMMVVYINELGEQVGHVLTGRTENGWQAKGANNSDVDPTLVTAGNFIGVIFGVFNTAGLPEPAIIASTELSRTPVVIGKRY